MQPGTPPALAAPTQFDAKHWDRVPREQVKATIERMTILGDYTEFVFKNGNAFQRGTDELNPAIKVHVNQLVHVETIGGELVTGMWVPEQGWLFRMTSQDLADYAKDVSTRMHRQRAQALEELRGYISLALREGIKEQVDLFGEEGTVLLSGPIDLDTLAQFVMDAMEAAKSAGAR